MAQPAERYPIGSDAASSRSSQADRLAPGFFHERVIADEVADAKRRQPRLPRAEEIARAAERQVTFRNLESVVRGDERVEPRPARVAERRLIQQDARGGRRPSPHAASQLVQL